MRAAARTDMTAAVTALDAVMTAPTNERQLVAHATGMAMLADALHELTLIRKSLQSDGR